MNNITTKSIAISVIGYLVLVSYTWPLGFAPVVSIQSLPILLLGLAVMLLVCLLYFLILFAPFSWLKDESFLRHIFYAGAYEELDDEYKNKKINIPFIQLLLDSRKVISWFGTIFGLLSILLILFFCFYLWYKTAYIFDDSRLLFSALLPMWLAYQSLIKLISAKSFKDAKLPALGVLLFYIIVPTSFSSVDDQRRLFSTPNFLVEKALSLIGAGGGIFADVNSLNGHSISGQLLFFDGQRAWLTPCNNPQVVIQTDIDTLSFNKSKTCQ